MQHLNLLGTLIQNQFAISHNAIVWTHFYVPLEICDCLESLWIDRFLLALCDLYSASRWQKCEFIADSNSRYFLAFTFCVCVCACVHACVLTCMQRGWKLLTFSGGRFFLPRWACRQTASQSDVSNLLRSQCVVEVLSAFTHVFLSLW